MQSSAPVLDTSIPVSFNNISTHQDPGSNQPPKHDMSIREQLQLWQQQQDAIAESNPSPITNSGSNAGILANYVTRAPGDDLVPEPARIESEPYDLDLPFNNDGEVITTNESQPLILPGDLVEMR